MEEVQWRVNFNFGCLKSRLKLSHVSWHLPRPAYVFYFRFSFKGGRESPFVILHNMHCEVNRHPQVKVPEESSCCHSGHSRSGACTVGDVQGSQSFESKSRA